MLCFCSKTYCCYDKHTNKYKFSSKGLQKRTLEDCRDGGPMSKYRKVLEESVNVTSTNRRFRTFQHSVATYEQTKKGLSYFYPKSHIKIRTSSKISAGVLIIRGRNSKKIRKNLKMPKKLSPSAKNESFHISAHCRTHSTRAQTRKTFGSQSESSITSSESNTLQLRQPIRIEHYVTRVEHYVTRELSARVGDPSRLSARVGSL